MPPASHDPGATPTLYLALLLHFYQPPGQIAGVLRRVVEESYRPLLRVFREHGNARASCNINGVLTEMLDDHGYGDVNAGLAELAAAGRIEFTRSAKYHPILPLIAPGDAARQIALNDETNARLLGSAYAPRGFFPPEMAWDHAVAPAVVRAGSTWVLTSGIACPAAWPVDRVYREAAGGGALAVLFRDDILSNQIAFRSTNAHRFLDELRRTIAAPAERYVIVAMDAETFGHHIPGWAEDFLGALFGLLAAQEPAPARPRARPAPAPAPVRAVTVSEIVDRFPSGGQVLPRAASWSTTREDLDHGNPFPLWRHRANELHRLLWRHLEQAMALLDTAQRHAAGDGTTDLATARAFADMALHSDQFWWASRRPHWSVNLVHRGLSMQRDVILNAVRAINLSDAPDDVRRDSQERVAIARDLADRLTDRLFWD